MKFIAFQCAGWLVALMILTGTPAWTMEGARVITSGDFFPEFSFPMIQAKSDIQYLGLRQKFFGLIRESTFSLKDVKADLILVEFLNKHCFSCQLQAPVMNQAFSMVEKDPQLKGRIKFIGIGVGNNQGEVDSFKAEKQIPFPIIPDPKFLAYEAIGDPGVAPFCLFLRKTESGLLVARMKAGLAKNPEMIFKELTDSLTAEVDALLKEFKDPSFQHFRAEKLRLGLNEEELAKHLKEIEKANRRISGIRILKGVEVDVLADGRLDLKDEILKECDVVLASVHSRFNLEEGEMTRRIIHALKNPNVDILAHPTGRLILEREPYKVNLKEVIQVAMDQGVVLEINAYPDRLDLKDVDARMAKEMGAKLVISTDAHSIMQLELMKFGVFTARRGWVEAKDVINTLPLEGLLKALRR